MRITSTLLITLFLLLSTQQGEAQFRSDIESTLDRTGNVLRPQIHTQSESSLSWFRDFRMDHSYDMTIGSFGGNMYNQNTYTNTMHMMFSENLYGRLDLAMSHSPFGNSMMGQDNQAQFYVRNAELQYRFSENTRIQLRFQQIPGGYGYGYHPHQRMGGYHSPFHQQRSHHPFDRW